MATATMGLRERKNARTQQAITRAALELSLEAGFERATVARIADRADVSPRTVHQWFPSKEDIVVGVDTSFRERLATELADGKGDLLDRLRRWMTAEGARRNEPEDIARLRHRVLLADPHLRAAQRGRLQDVEQLFTAAIAEQTGCSPDAIAPRALAAAVAATLLALQEAFADGTDADATQVEDTFGMLSAALDQLGAPNSVPSRHRR